MNSLFDYGRIFISPGASQVFQMANENPHTYLNRHLTGDWGDLDDHDKSINRQALHQNLRLFSSYILKNKERIYIITESNRQTTTILTPDEY